jgi:hypothetical protein
MRFTQELMLGELFSVAPLPRVLSRTASAQFTSWQFISMAGFRRRGNKPRKFALQEPRDTTLNYSII